MSTTTTYSPVATAAPAADSSSDDDADDEDGGGRSNTATAALVAVATATAAATGPARQFPPKRAVFVAAAACCYGLMHAVRAAPSIVSDGPAGMAAELGWSNTDKGAFLSAFFAGCACHMCYYLALLLSLQEQAYEPHTLMVPSDIVTQIPGGYATSRFGGRRTLLVATALVAVASTLTPPAAAASFPAGLAMRVVCGLAEGPVFPSLMAMTWLWLPRHELGRAVATINAAAAFGQMVAFAAAPAVMAALGWRWTYWLAAGAMALWCRLWWANVHAAPVQHPAISVAELALLSRGRRLE
jgi:MFS family permease